MSPALAMILTATMAVPGAIAAAKKSERTDRYGEALLRLAVRRDTMP